MQDLSGSGIEPMSPSLAGRLFTIEPPGRLPFWHSCSILSFCSHSTSGTVLTSLTGQTGSRRQRLCLYFRSKYRRSAQTIKEKIIEYGIYFPICESTKKACILTFKRIVFSSVPFSCSVVSDSLRPHGLQHARPPCPSPTPRACSNSCPLSQWCHPTIFHPLSSPSLSAFNLSHHQGLFQWAGSSHQVAKALELQHQSFQWIFRTDIL